MMLSHDQLEGTFYVLGVAFAGWGAYVQAQKSRFEEKLGELKEGHDKHQVKLDEIDKGYITRADHAQSQKEINETIEKLGMTLTAAIKELASRFDKFLEKEYYKN